jgi:hypothetical protein
MSTDTTIPEDLIDAAAKICRSLGIASTPTNCLPIIEGLKADRQRDQWQPIETAPKDWTDILLYLPDEDDGTGARGVVKGWYSMADGGFDCWMSYDTNAGQCYPTKWMPLPAAPKAEG